MNQIIECYKDVWVNWKNFSGRTRRSGYWYAFLANMIVAFVLGFISGLVEPLSILVSIYSLLVLVPYIQGGDRSLASVYALAFTGSALVVFALFETLIRRWQRRGDKL